MIREYATVGATTTATMAEEVDTNDNTAMASVTPNIPEVRVDHN